MSQTYIGSTKKVDIEEQFDEITEESKMDDNISQERRKRKYNKYHLDKGRHKSTNNWSNNILEEEEKQEWKEKRKDNVKEA